LRLIRAIVRNSNPLARWQSGYAEDCKSLHVGSIPARASKSIHAITREFNVGLPSNMCTAPESLFDRWRRERKTTVELFQAPNPSA
jgi:hypothetical protein